ncbi:MAG: hypothetical protein ACI82F_004012, partial [Planctomycetota bacterium]
KHREYCPPDEPYEAEDYGPRSRSIAKQQAKRGRYEEEGDGAKRQGKK